MDIILDTMKMLNARGVVLHEGVEEEGDKTSCSLSIGVECTETVKELRERKKER